MQLYLPIAEVSVNAFVLLGLGGVIGVLSGMFGVGGGFLITPLLMMIGVPPGVAVATGANQVVASSISGALAQFKRRAVDLPMGAVLTGGGLVCTTVQKAPRVGQRTLGLFCERTRVTAGRRRIMRRSGKSARSCRRSHAGGGMVRSPADGQGNRRDRVPGTR